MNSSRRSPNAQLVEASADEAPKMAVNPIGQGVEGFCKKRSMSQGPMGGQPHELQEVIPRNPLLGQHEQPTQARRELSFPSHPPLTPTSPLETCQQDAVTVSLGQHEPSLAQPPQQSQLSLSEKALLQIGWVPVGHGVSEQQQGPADAAQTAASHKDAPNCPAPTSPYAKQHACGS